MDSEKKKAWQWVPSLYFAEGLPYVIIMTVSVVMYKKLGLSNADIALYTSWLYLPWVIKWLWSPVVQLINTNRYWIILMQLFIGVGFAGVAFTIPTDSFFQYTLAFFWLMAFSSATHDIACDGFYMQAMSKHQQTWFVGIRSTFYRLSMITGQGLIVIIAGYIESTTGLPSQEVKVESTVETIVQKDTSFKSGSTEALSIVFDTKSVKIPLHNIEHAKLDSVQQKIKTLNTDGGHSDIQQPDQDKQLATSEHQLSPFETWIKTTFGQPKPEVSATSGNYGIARLQLSKAPDKLIKVNFGRDKGSKNITLVEGTYFEFDSTNWDHPRYALFSLDPKLETRESAVFVATAGNVKLSWVTSFFILAVLFILFLVYHRIKLPTKMYYEEADRNDSILKEFSNVFVSFFRKPQIGIVMAFLLLYRLGESQLVKMSSPFLLDKQEIGGLGLTTGEIGLVYGTFGIVALTLGGILGGIVAARNGLKFWLPWMVLAINIPNAVYIFLSYTKPESLMLISGMVTIEQFGYGFGFTAYMLYILYISYGKYQTAHYAICTGFMALGMMLPGMFSGWLQELIGYQHFFIWVLIATVPSFIVVYFTKVDPEFGKKE